MSHNVNIKQHDLGSRGGNIIADTTATDGDWCQITALEGSTKFTTLSSNTISGDITGLSTGLSSGTSLYGQYSHIKLSGGAVIAYNR